MTLGVTETELIALAQKGDDAALGRLLQLHEDRLRRHLRVRVPRSARTFDAADIVQQTFIEAVRDFANFEHRGEGSLFAWLKRISEHRLKNAIRSLNTQKRGGSMQRVAGSSEGCSQAFDLLQELAGDEDVTASWNVSRAEAQSALRAALAGLPDDYRAAMQLRYFDGLSVEETADQVGRSPAAVRGLTDRAKARLRDVLIRMSLYMSVR